MEQNFFRIFLDQKTTVKLREEARGATRGPQALEARPPRLVGPLGLPNPNSIFINTQIFPVHQRIHQKYFFAASSFCSREIPSWGLFRHSVGGGFDHGGPLHQP